MDGTSKDSEPEKRHYHDTSAAYSLPNDHVEQDRLELQAIAFEKMMSDDVFHAPLSNPKRILDIGCGTGRTTVQLAQRFPDAQVIGIDLSPVPAIHPKPQNVEYVQGDFRELVKTDTATFAPSSFDYVFSRLLVLGMKDWPGYIAETSSILSPGGWLELHEWELEYINGRGNALSPEIPVLKRLRDLARLKGLDPNIAVEAPRLMRDCGLVDIDTTFYKTPQVEQPDSPTLAMISKLLARYPVALRSLWYRLGEDIYNQEELDRFSREYIDMGANFEPDTYMRFHVVTGRKAL